MPRKRLIGPDVSGLAGLKEKEKKPIFQGHAQVGSVKTRMPTAMKQAGRGKK